MHAPLIARFACLALALVAGCGTPEKQAESPFAPAPDPNEGPPSDILARKPWTREFEKSAVLIAQDVRVEGPDGLLEHFVARQELEFFDVDTKTTRDGLLQTMTIKPGVPNAEIRAQLDNLAITCFRRLEVLERPGDVPVVVLARGDAFYQETGSPTPQRGETLRFVGAVER
jgi:hypothetical protein